MSNVEKLHEMLATCEIHWFNSAVNISLKHRFIYVENPKVASSTIKSRLHVNEIAPLKNVRVGPHPDIANSPFVKPYQLPEEMLADCLFGTEFYKFTFVRNPFNRLLSSYLDKIVGKAPEKGYVDGFWKRKYEEPKDDYSFSDFLEYISETMDRLRDKHWRTQTNITLFSFIDYSFVGRFESLNEHLLHIQNEAGIDFNEVKEVSPHKTNADTRIVEFFDAENLQKTLKVYKNDFDNFGYARSV
jgi:Sulfotransferase family